MLDKLMYYSEARKEFEAGIAYGTRILFLIERGTHSTGS